MFWGGERARKAGKPLYNRDVSGTIAWYFGRGAIAQLARAPPLQGGGPGFESLLLHQNLDTLGV